MATIAFIVFFIASILVFEILFFNSQRNHETKVEQTNAGVIRENFAEVRNYNGGLYSNKKTSTVEDYYTIVFLRMVYSE